MAMKESDWIIAQLNRKVLSGTAYQPMPKANRPYQLAVLGPKNTFSSLAAKHYLPRATLWHAPTITDVFECVQKGVAHLGIVPIENKLTGSVAETMQNLFTSPLKIIESFAEPIHHCLATLDEKNPKKIKTIYSHAQPLKQCRLYLKKHSPAKAHPKPSTPSPIILK